MKAVATARPIGNVGKGLLRGIPVHQIDDAHTVLEEPAFAHGVLLQAPAGQANEGVCILIRAAFNGLQKSLDGRFGKNSAKTAIWKS